MATLPPPPQLRAYSYVRFSTAEQSQGRSLQRQIELAREYALKHELILDEALTFRDLGVSAFRGRNVAEGALGAFLAAVKEGRVQRGSYLLVESLDRVSREAPYDAAETMRAIVSEGVTVVDLQDSGRVYNTEILRTDHMAFLMMVVRFMRSNEESTRKSERVSDAWAKKRANACASFQPMTAKCPAWLELVKDKKVLPGGYRTIKDRVATIRQIFEEASAGIGIYAITRRLNEQKVPHFGISKGWYPSYVAKILKNRSVIGDFQPHRLVAGKRKPTGEVIPNYFPVIVDEKTFHAVQQGLALRRNHGAGRKGNSVSNLFSRLLVCAYCHCAIRFENKGLAPNRGKSLVCDGAKRGTGCAIARWKYDYFEASFLAFVRAIDLDKILRGDDVAKRRDLDFEISALEGKQTIIQNEMEKTFKLLSIAGTAASYVAEQLQKQKARLVEVEADLKEKLKDKSGLTAAVGRFYESKEQIKALIAEVQAKDGDDLYKLRSQISSKLKSLVQRVYVAPLGTAPFIEKASPVEGLTEQEENHRRSILNNPDHHRRFVGVAFADGTACVVYPNDHDPLQFEQQFLDNKRDGAAIFKFGEWISGYSGNDEVTKRALDDEDAIPQAVFDDLA